MGSLRSSSLCSRILTQHDQSRGGLVKSVAAVAVLEIQVNGCLRWAIHFGVAHDPGFAEQGGGVAGVKFQGLVETGDRFIDSSELGKDFTAIVVDLHIAEAQTDRLVD